MNSSARSLHLLVDKWLAPTTVLHVRVIRSGRMLRQRARFVYVETHTPDGPRGMFFFRHEDRCWHVFPPHDARPTLCVHALAA
jgi:hypothetical protein